MPLTSPIRFQRAADQRLWDGPAPKFRQARLTCPVFLTGPEILPKLHEQRIRSLTLIDNAKGCGHTRVAEMNQQVADNLDRMIGEMETVRRPRMPADNSHLITAASCRRSASTRRRAMAALRRLEAATERNRQLEAENRELREALALALGERRTDDIRGRRDTRCQRPQG